MSFARIKPELEAWLLENIEGTAGRLLGSGYQATVRWFASPAGEIVVKSPHSGAVLGWLGRLAIRREARIYGRLAGIDGVPRCPGLADDKHLVLEHIAGPALRAHELQLENRQRFYTLLLETIQSMHAAGVAHGDLKRKENVIVGDNETPYIVDFGIACLRKPIPGRINKFHFELIRQMDLNAWIKLKYGRRPTDLSPADAAIYRPLKLERIARAIRIPWQKLTLRRPRQRWRKGKDQE